jgi:tetratricopeptide (TPR) repeat protein
LLALGWAYLLPSGPANEPAAESGAKLQPVVFEAPRLRPGDADAIAETRRLTPFRYQQAEAKDERALDIRRALVPWAELIGRDPLDPAVQEGMLAVPYALDHFGAHTQALDFYQRALAQLSAAHDTLNAAQAQLRSGDLLQRLNQRDARDDSGWPRLLVTMRDDGEVLALRQYNTDASFAAALQRYRQLQALQSALAADPRAAPLLQQASSVQQQLQPLLAAQAGAVTAAAQQVLTRLGEQTDRYRVEAHFALARANDHLPNEPAFGGATR